MKINWGKEQARKFFYPPQLGLKSATRQASATLFIFKWSYLIIVCQFSHTASGVYFSVVE